MTSSTGDDGTPLELLVEEFLERQRRGEHPAVSEYTAAYPELADEIRELLPVLAMVERFKPVPEELKEKLAKEDAARPAAKKAVAQDAPADAEHQWPVPVHERGESTLVSFGGKPIQEDGIGHFVRFGLRHQAMDVAEQSVGARCHDGGSRGPWPEDASSILHYIAHQCTKRHTDFAPRVRRDQGLRDHHPAQRASL